MNEHNLTRITKIQLVGFQTGIILSYFIFFVLLSIYCVTICGNLLIITLVSYSKTLHSPMYFFLSHLSVSDIILTTDIVPNTLHTLLVKEIIISFSSCFLQFNVYSFVGCLECLLLTAMSYDRYLAICKPLHYTSIMSQQLCWVMVSMCWGLSLLVILNDAVTISKLNFCGPNVIDHIFCDLKPIIHLSCSDTTNFELEITLLGFVLLIIPFSCITVSYFYIIIAIFQTPSGVGKQKVFSTCSSHLSVVCTYFGTLVCVYMVPTSGKSINFNKFLSLLYTAGTPLMNPIIYSLRNKDLKQIMKNKLMSLRFKKKLN